MAVRSAGPHADSQSGATGGKRRTWRVLRLPLRALIVALVIACGPVFALAAFAQSPPAPSNPPARNAEPGAAPAELERLIAVLENEAARTRLLEHLRQSGAVAAADTEAPAIAERPASRMMLTLAESVTEIGASLGDAAVFLVDLPRLYAWIADRLADEDRREHFWSALFNLALILGAGAAAQLLVAPLAAGWRRRAAEWNPRSRWPGALRAGAGLAAGAAPILAFWVAALIVTAVLQPRSVTALVAVLLVNAQVAAAALSLLSRSVLAPQFAALRPVALDDATAQRLHARLRAIFFVAAYGYCLAMIATAVGMFVAAYDTLTSILGIVIAGMIAWLVWRERALLHAAVGRVARRNGGGQSLPAIWHWPILAYLLVALVIWLSDGDEGMAFLARASALSFVAVSAAIVAILALRRGLRFAVERGAGLRREDPGFPARLQAYAQVARFAAIGAIAAAVMLVIADAWGAPVGRWIGALGGVHLAASVLSLAMVAAVAAALWEGINLLVERLMRAESIRGDDLRRAARQRTLLPMVRRASMAVLCVLFGLIVLSELGVNIGPLLAGAGVVGIAVGFGAQAIVKDIFGGISVLTEDSIAVGDIVQVAGKGGVVDWMSMRAVRLRDFDGAVHTVPFGEITTVSNLTKSFAFAVFRIAVTYDTDVAKVQAIIRDIIGDMRRDSELGPMILEDVELHGVDSFAESGVVVLARVKVGPAKQWTVSRQFHLRLKRAFSDHDIPIPFPRRMIASSPEPITHHGAAAAGAAAE